MLDKFDIPKELRYSFQRIFRKIPAELRDDTKLLEAALLYLKFGGDKLARQRVEVAAINYHEDVKILKKQLREEAMRRAATESDEASDENDDEEDQDENEDEDEDKEIENDDDDFGDEGDSFENSDFL